MPSVRSATNIHNLGDRATPGERKTNCLSSLRPRPDPCIGLTHVLFNVMYAIHADVGPTLFVIWLHDLLRLSPNQRPPTSELHDVVLAVG